jgi:hypothetical protein
MTKVTLEFDFEDDSLHLDLCLRAKQFDAAIEAANNIIRNRLKYGEDISEKEDQTLMQIRDALNLHYILND